MKPTLRVTDIAEDLGCNRQTAWRIMREIGRQLSPGLRGSKWIVAADVYEAWKRERHVVVRRGRRGAVEAVPSAMIEAFYSP